MESQQGQPAETRPEVLDSYGLAYGILAAVIWFTLGEGTVLVLGRPVEIRLIPLFVIGTFVFRTCVAREADKIRRQQRERSEKL